MRHTCQAALTARQELSTTNCGDRELHVCVVTSLVVFGTMDVGREGMSTRCGGG